MVFLMNTCFRAAKLAYERQTIIYPCFCLELVVRLSLHSHLIDFATRVTNVDI